MRTLLIAILSWVAEEERRQIASRSKLGVERARAAGKVIGRKPIPIETERLVALKAEGLSVRQIANRLGLTKSTVHKALMGVREVPPNSSVVQVSNPAEIVAR